MRVKQDPKRSYIDYVKRRFYGMGDGVTFIHVKMPHRRFAAIMFQPLGSFLGVPSGFQSQNTGVKRRGRENGRANLSLGA